MFIKKEKYNKLQKELEEEKKKTIMLQEKINALETFNSLKGKEKAKSNIESLLRKQGYQYAILVKNYADVKLYNDGRIEKGVRSIDFSSSGGYVPELTIKK